MPAFDPGGENEAGFHGSLSTKQPDLSILMQQINVSFFWRNKALCRVLWGGVYHLPWLAVKKTEQHWRCLIARWGALPVAWRAAGETTMLYYLSGHKDADKIVLKTEWTNVIQYLKKTDPFNRILTTHAAHFCPSTRQSVTNPLLLDFDMHQNGHDHVNSRQAAQALAGWNLLYPKHRGSQFLDF